HVPLVRAARLAAVRWAALAIAVFAAFTAWAGNRDRVAFAAVADRGQRLLFANELADLAAGGSVPAAENAVAGRREIRHPAAQQSDSNQQHCDLLPGHIGYLARISLLSRLFQNQQSSINNR